MFSSAFDKVNEFIDRIFTAYARSVGRRGAIILTCGLLLVVGFSLGLLNSKTEKDINALWVDLDSRVVNEKREFERFFGGTSRTLLAATTNTDKSPIFSRKATRNLPSPQDVLEAHREAMSVWARENVTFKGKTYGHRDFCQRPLVPIALQPPSKRKGPTDFETASLSSAYQKLTTCLAADRDFKTVVYPGFLAQYRIENLVGPNFTPLPAGWGISEFPCSRVSVLDCFREGQEVDYDTPLMDLQKVAGAVTAYATTVQGMVDRLAKIEVKPGLKLGGFYQNFHCWLRDADGGTACLPSGANLATQKKIILNVTAELQKELFAAAPQAISAALNLLIAKVNRSTTQDAFRTAAANLRRAIVKTLQQSTSYPVRGLGYYFKLKDMVQNNKSLTNQRLDGYCVENATTGVVLETSHRSGRNLTAKQLKHILQGSTALTAEQQKLVVLYSTVKLQLGITTLLLSSFGYWWRKSFRTMSSAEVLDHFTDAAESAADPNVSVQECILKQRACCMTWNGATVGTSLLMGGGARGTPRSVQNTTKSEVFNSIIAIRSGLSNYNPNHPAWLINLQIRHPSTTWANKEDREDLAKEFDKQLTASWLKLYKRKPGSNYEAGGNYSRLKLDFITGNSLKDLITDATTVPADLLATSYVVMIVYVMLSLGNYLQAVFCVFRGEKREAALKMVKSHSLLGLVGICIVAASSVAGIGLASLCTVVLNGISLNLVPFVSLGLGIDDMFVLVHTMSEQFSLSKTAEENLAQTLRFAGPSVLLTSVANAVAFFIVVVVPVSAIRQLVVLMAISVITNLIFLLLIFVPCMLFDLRRQASNRMDLVLIHIEPDRKEKREDTLEIEESTLKSDHSLINSFIDDFYAPFLSHPIIKAVVVVVFLTAFSVLIWSGVEKTERGLRTSDIALKDTYQRDTAELTETILTTNIVSAVSISEKAPFSQNTAQQQLLNMYSSLEQSPWVIQGMSVKNTAWLSNSPTSLAAYYNMSGPQILRTKQLNCAPSTRDQPIADEACYKAFFPIWFRTAGVGYVPDLHCHNGTNGPTISCESPLATVAASVSNVYVQGLQTHNDHINAIKDLRRRVDKHSDRNIHSYMFGSIFLFWEQYFNISSTLLKVIGNGLLGVFVVTFLFQLNPWLSAIICTTIFMITMELYGFSRPVGIKLNAISAANFCISIGLAVEFTAHIARAFLLASGSRDNRMCLALKKMMVPMINGALSTVLSIIPLIGNKFPFFRLYYAAMFILMVAIACINGLLFLPVVLSLVGPPSQKVSQSK